MCGKYVLILEHGAVANRYKLDEIPWPVLKTFRVIARWPAL
jgi:hypothetical protein